MESLPRVRRLAEDLRERQRRQNSNRLSRSYHTDYGRRYRCSESLVVHNRGKTFSFSDVQKYRDGYTSMEQGVRRLPRL